MYSNNFPVLFTLFQKSAAKVQKKIQLGIYNVFLFDQKNTFLFIENVFAISLLGIIHRSTTIILFLIPCQLFLLKRRQLFLLILCQLYLLKRRQLYLLIRRLSSARIECFSF